MGRLALCSLGLTFISALSLTLDKTSNAVFVTLGLSSIMTMLGSYALRLLFAIIGDRLVEELITSVLDTGESSETHTETKDGEDG